MSRFALAPDDEAATLVGLLDNLLDSGVHVAGDLVLGLADVELVRVALRLLVASEDTVQRTAQPQPASPTPAPPSRPAARPPPTAPPPADVPRRPVAAPAARPSTAIEGDDQRLADGVARLVLTLVALIHDLVERQAVRRVEGGRLTDDQIERLGLALQALEERMAQLRDVFGVTDDDLNLDLGPLGRLR